MINLPLFILKIGVNKHQKPNKMKGGSRIMNASNFLLITTLVLFFMAILKSALETDKALRTNNYYHVYKNHKIHEDYDFLELLRRERKYYPIATLISLGAYILSLLIQNETLNNLLVLVIFFVLGFSLHYLRPRKKK